MGDMMDEMLSDEHKNIIRKSLPLLTMCLNLHGLIMAHLHQESIIDQKQYQQIKCYPTHEEQVRYLITEVILRSPRLKYLKLEEVLYKTNNEHIVEVLRGNFNENSGYSPPQIQRTPEEERLLNDEEKRSIQSNMAILVQCISPHCDLYAHLQQADVLTTPEKHQTSHSWSEENIRAILRLILKGPKWKYDAFLQALDSCAMEFLTDRIRNRPTTTPPVQSPSEDAPSLPPFPQNDVTLLTAEEKEMILDNMPNLVSGISISALFYAYLQQEQVITTEDKNQLTRKSRSSQALHLLLLLMRKPKRTLTSFNKALDKCEMGHIKINPRDGLHPHCNWLWDRWSEAGQVVLSEDKIQALRKNLVQITQIIHLSDDLWAHLLHYRVVSIHQREEIKGSSNKPQWMQVTDLVSQIMRGPTFAYHGFLRSMHDATMDHLIELLGENPILYS